MTAFEEMGVLPEIAKAVEEMEWMLPTDIQAEAIPLILGGGDILMAAETGSGKTGAFCLPILQIVWETLKDIESGKALKSSKTPNLEWRLNLLDRGLPVAVSPDGLKCQSRDQKQWHGCRATKGVQACGKYFYEATVTDQGLCRVGWSTLAATLDLGTDQYGFGFGGTGKKSNNKQFESYGESFGMMDVIGCAIDLDSGAISFFKNGVNLGQAFTIPNNLRNFPFFPAVVLKNAEISFNFGSHPFKYNPPNGYMAVYKASGNCVKNSDIGAAAGTNGTTFKRQNNAPQALVIEPSRELAEQTHSQIEKFKKYLDSPKVREVLVIGGVPIKNQMNEISAGVDIVVGTPGRLEELINNSHLSLSHCRFFVVDEVDGILKGGYGGLIDRLHARIPKFTQDGKRLQVVLCSATISNDFDVKKAADRLTHFPTWVDLKGEDTVPETVHHVVVKVDPQRDQSWKHCKLPFSTDGVHNADHLKPDNPNAETLSEATKLLKAVYCAKAIDKMKMDRALIFCRTKLDCDNLERYFIHLGRNNANTSYSSVCLHGDRKPAERKENLEAFKRGRVKFLICTDVAARGIDISGLPFVINVTLPDEKSNYVHRIGRVGRAERMGLAISLVSTVPEKVWYHGQWCPSRGQSCNNTQLTDRRGCCIWYNELQYLADIEDHLKVTIQQIGPEMDVPVDEFDGKVVYGQKMASKGVDYQPHTALVEPVARELEKLERLTQSSYLRRYIKGH